MAETTQRENCACSMSTTAYYNMKNETMPTTDEAMYYTPTSVHDLNVTPHRLINSSSHRFVTPRRNVLVTPSEYPFVTPPRFTESVNRSSVTLVLFTDTDDHSSQTPPKLAKYTNDSFSTPPRSRDTENHSLVTLKLFTDNLDESYLSPSRFTECVNHPFVTPPRSTDLADNSFVNLAPTRESDNHSLTTSPTFIHTVFVTPRKSRRAILSDSMITPLRAANHVRHSALTPSPSLNSISSSRPATRRRLSFSNSEISPARTDVSAKRPSSVKNMQNERHVCRAKRNKTAFSDKQIVELEEVFTRNKHPDAYLREQLAIEMGVTDKAIRVWFKTRRAKCKHNNMRKLSSRESKTSSHNDVITTTNQRSHHSLRLRV